ncbi:chromate transporter [Thalassobacillus devorans]|uniref:Chromate transporter n=1 Tax=Thalassobacillus devorans TaxID=279813 RepID=A0ABQ1PL82_9BACI|nr:chromate transporter [Thalassobacillus devorans]NIK30203.1 chromate transporter [Thalassobacillus devorans]GGC99170.1 chromate transporter [Thalassobacillus devorans]
MLLLNLFIEFFKIGLFGFGGGYAMIPLMEQAIQKHKWISLEQFTDIIAISGSSPGPIATNSALFIGYQTAGIIGAAIAVISNLLPSFLMVMVLTKLLTLRSQPKYLFQSLNGIHPVIVALILYAGVRMGLQTGLFTYSREYSPYFILILSIVLLVKNISPVWVMIISGTLGVLINSF